MSTITVNSTAALNAALATATAGETIQLAAGTYTGVVINNFNAGGGVTITSADSNHEAVLSGLHVSGSSGLNFTNLQFSFAGIAATLQTASPPGVTIASSNNIVMDHDSFAGQNTNAQGDTRGLYVNQSSNVTIQNSEFQQLRVGIVETNNNNITISNNNIHNISVDGIDNGGSSNVVITGNELSDFNLLTGAHADAIQFWTTHTTTAAQNITVTNNAIVQGSGTPMQGVFIQDDVGGLHFQNVNVSNNVVVGGLWNAISVNGADGLNVANNVVTTLSSQAQTPWVRVTNSNDATVSQNSALKYQLTANNTALAQSSNKTTGTVSDNGLSVLNTWLAQHQHATVGAATGSQLIGHPTSTPISSSDTIQQALANTPTSDTDINGSSSPTSLASNSGSSGTGLTGGSGAGATTPSAPIVASGGHLTIDGVAITGQVLTGQANQPNQLYGGAGNDYLVGGSQHDLLNGGSGNDVLTGGGGGDTFVFNRDAGQAIITDFSGKDQLSISAVEMVGMSVHNTGAGAVIDLAGGATVTLLGVSANELHQIAGGFALAG